MAPGDAQSLAKLVVRLSETAKETLAQKGASGRAFYEENFMKENTTVQRNFLRHDLN